MYVVSKQLDLLLACTIGSMLPAKEGHTVLNFTAWRYHTSKHNITCRKVVCQNLPFSGSIVSYLASSAAGVCAHAAGVAADTISAIAANKSRLQERGQAEHGNLFVNRTG